MKSLFLSITLMALFSVNAFAEEMTLQCRLDMQQFKSDQKWIPTIGDSNQRLLFKMKEEKNGKYVAFAHARFENDQSEDDSLSLHGIFAQAIYKEGNGLKMILQVVKYDSQDEDSKYTPVASALQVTDFEKSLAEGAESIEFAYMNPKAFSKFEKLDELLKDGIVKDYELFIMGVAGCRAL